MAGRESAACQIQEVIVLDTNIVSALIQDEPDRKIQTWIDGLPRSSVWLTAITVFEIRYGIERLPKSRRRQQLEDEFARVLDIGLQNRILALEADAAAIAAALAAKRKREGQPAELRDTLIAGIVISRRAEFVTCNTRHFRDLPIRVIDPWTV